MKTTLLVPLLLAGTAAIAGLDGEAGVPMWLRLRTDLVRAQERVATLSAEAEALRAEIRALSSDPFAMERAIREDLELTRPGEILVRFGRGAGRPTREDPRPRAALAPPRTPDRS